MLGVRRRRLAAVVAIALLGLSACTGSAGTEEPGAVRAPGPCDGVRYDEVRGPRPTYAGTTLAGFDNDEAMCRGLWLPHAGSWFVPQGIALDGDTAWVSGYRWRPRYGQRPCQVLHVDLRTGRQIAFERRLDGAVPDGPDVFCHHGGGLALDDHGLWVAETGRLWLLDPGLVGTGRDPVRRVWRLDDPLSGGFLVAGRPGAFALGDFHVDRDSTAHWFRFEDVLDPAVTTLVERAGRSFPPSRQESLRTTVAPRYAQGGSVRGQAGRAFLTSSISTCGVLVTPTGERLAFGPGAEGIAFDGGGGVWAVLESGSRAYQEKGRPLTPMLARFDVGQLLAGDVERCSW